MKTRKSALISVMKKTKLITNGFTLIELLVALIVSSIVLTAIVTLSYAMSSAYENTNDMNKKQAHIRYATLRLSELIKQSKVICGSFSDGLVIWAADNNNDNKINVSEIIYIETGGGKYLRLLKFNPSNPSSDNSLLLLHLRNVYYKSWLVYLYPETYTTLIDQCSNMEITLDSNPPYTQFISVVFDLNENGQTRTYQISSRLRCRVSNLIRTEYSFSDSDDDS
jgi:prepilin-type N-terminal cleavage/methylation domain-containing protein